MTRYFFILICTGLALTGWSQEVRLRSSPLDVISMRYKDAYIKITYSQPVTNGQEIFGKVVPYGKPWSPGMNEATEITTTKDITMGSFLVKAGTYTLFTVPEKDKWTIIISKDLGLWGSYNYNPRQDLLKFTVAAQALPEVYEPLTLKFDQRNDVANLFDILGQNEDLYSD